MLKRRKFKNIPNLLDLKPERLVDCEKRDDGMYNLVIPKFKNRLLRQLFGKRMKKPIYRMELDDIGSCVWDLIDGSNNVEMIGKKLKEKFGDRVEPVYERLNLFLYTMKQYEYIRWVNWSNC